MTIGIVTSWFERGAAYVSRQFMDVLKDTDEVCIYVRGGEKYAKGNPKWDLPNVYWGKRSKFVEYYASYIDKKDFIKWLKQKKIDAVLFNEQHYFTPVIWCKELGIKTVAYIDYYREDTIPLFNVYDCLICNTKRHHFAFRNHPNAQYLKWGTNIDTYKPIEEVHDKITFFHSAGMGPVRKGTDILIRAFKNCKKHRDALLLIHTQVSLSSVFPDLSETIEELKKEGSLEIIEKTISAPGLYHKGDVYVYPSRLDGIGLTLMEAISSGLPCITANNGPMNEFIETSFGSLIDVEYFYSRSDGYYWPIGVTSEKNLTETMDNYIENQDDLPKMKKLAREYAVRELDFQKNCKKLHDIIESSEYSFVDKRLKSRIQSFDQVAIKRIMYVFYRLYQPIKKWQRR